MNTENYTFFVESQKSFLSLSTDLLLTGGFLVLLLLNSCSPSKEDQLPVRQDVLTSALFDLQMAQSRQEVRLNTDTTTINWREAILSVHGITGAQLDSSLMILAENPELFKEIQADIQERISRVDRSLNNR